MTETNHQLQQDLAGRPILPDQELTETCSFMAKALAGGGGRFTDSHGTTIDIPPALARVLAAAAVAMSHSRAVGINTFGLEVGIREASYILNVSAEWLAREAGDREVPSLGYNRDRFSLPAILEWKETRDEARAEALQELTNMFRDDYEGECR